MNINTDAIDEVALALLYLTLHDHNRAWRGFDWDVLNRLYERGLIGDPVNKTESVIFSHVSPSGSLSSTSSSLTVGH